jgi:hypothetical protein
MQPLELSKLRRLALTERTSRGEEAVRVSVQSQANMTAENRESRRRVLEAWQLDLADKLRPFRGEVVPDSLSLTAQTVEVNVPVEMFDAVRMITEAEHLRLDFVTRRQAVGI